MTTTTTGELVYDPYDHETIFDPHALFKRLRDESPLYYSEEHDFFAISQCYGSFPQVDDREVVAILRASPQRAGPAS